MSVSVTKAIGELLAPIAREIFKVWFEERKNHLDTTYIPDSSDAGDAFDASIVQDNAGRRPPRS